MKSHGLGMLEWRGCSVNAFFVYIFKVKVRAFNASDLHLVYNAPRSEELRINCVHLRIFNVLQNLGPQSAYR